LGENVAEVARNDTQRHGRRVTEEAPPPKQETTKGL